MPSKAFGRSSRFVALILLLVSVWTSSHRQQDDDACLPIVAGDHDASKHAFVPTGTVDHEHCAVCHWMRGLKPSFASSTIISTPLAHAEGPCALAVMPYGVSASGRLPARAPPVFFL